MLHDSFQTLLWITVILLAISGIDDLYLDMLYGLMRRRHKSIQPDISRMHDKREKPIAIMLGAWNESGVIGRTLSFAISNLKYTNYRIFVGVYPNDLKTIRTVKGISKNDKRVKVCINPTEGPTTKADNLNSIYAALCEYEKKYGEFEIIIVHDAEDFIHPFSMKLYNYLIGYCGYHGVQIPVVPIKSKLGNIYHRTYCDAFAEIHTKDMIVRQSMGTFIPYSGTGMGFHRKTMYYLEKFYLMKERNIECDITQYDYKDQFGKKVELSESYFNNIENDEIITTINNDTNYKENPFDGLNLSRNKYKTANETVVRRFTFVFMAFLLSGISYLIYLGNNEIEDSTNVKILGGLIIQKAYGTGSESTNYESGGNNLNNPDYSNEDYKPVNNFTYIKNGLSRLKICIRSDSNDMNEENKQQGENTED